MFKEVSPAIFELEKTGDMRVPVRVVAEKQLLDKMMTDRTLQQAKNVATLPGILDAAFVMSDGHEGYGFPIGGVAAFDVEEGIVSPGGVGYDINCLKEGSRVLSEFGYFKKIEDFEENFGKLANTGNYQLSLQLTGDRVASLEGKTLSKKPLLAFMKKPSDKKMLKITTKTGLELECSVDHPLFTGNGFEASGKLKKGDKISVVYFTGVPYKRTENEEKKAILAKLLGYFIGDGTLYKTGKKMRACAYGKRKDLEKIKEDIERLGFNATVIERTRNHAIVTQYGKKEFTATNAELYVSSKAFCELILEYGMPLGKKTSIEFGVPEWILSEPLWIQRLFLAGFFGAELSSPATHTKTGFDSPVISQNKNLGYKENGREFLIQVLQMLENFGIKTSKISERGEFPNKQGQVARLRLQISSEEENLLRLWRMVGFEYNEKRQKLAEDACKYILLKKKIHSKRVDINKLAKDYKSKGLTLKETQKLLSDKDCNERFIERCFYENAGQRITLDFISFKAFVKECAETHEKIGTLQDEIESIEETDYKGMVYDFTVAETHNFIANNLVVSNCGVRLIRTNLSDKQVTPKMSELVSLMFQNVPSGVGTKAKIRYTPQQLEEPAMHGLKWALEKGFAVEKDLEHCEENGFMEGGDFSKVSDMAKKRGAPQIGSLGSGNHFAEIQRVEKIYDEEKAKAFGLYEGQVTIMAHTGSRGYGHQTCDDYLRVSLQAAQKYGIKLADRELCCAPLDSKEAQDYLGAMRTAINYAFCNRQLLTHWIRETFSSVFKKSWDSLEMDLVYDVCHNIAKYEEHKGKQVFVHRKGATRAFGPGRKEVPQAYRSIGQPVLIPGSMETASYVLCGLSGSELTYGSSCHGAGRVMSRKKAMESFGKTNIKKQMAERGTMVQATQDSLLEEEAGAAYKDIDMVVKSVQAAGVSKIVAKLVPLGVVKG